MQHKTRCTRPFAGYLTMGQHHLALLALLLTPAATLAETTQTIRVIKTDADIEQHTTYPTADYDHCHFDDAHGHLHCYIDQLGHQCDQVTRQQPNTITRSTRRFSEPTTIVERHYQTNVVPQPNIILDYGNTHRFRSHQYFGQRPGVFLHYNNFLNNNSRNNNSRNNNQRYGHRYNNRYNNNHRYDRRHNRDRSNHRYRNPYNH